MTSAPGPEVPFSEDQRYDYDLSAASVVLDAGAFEGTFSREISRQFGCRVFAFEPIRRYYEIACAQQAPAVRVFNFGLGAGDRTETISIRGDGSSILLDGEETEQVEIRGLERALDELGLRHIDLLKLNVEGCEYEILEHAVSTGLVERFENIQVQFHAFVPDAERRREAIRTELSRTHRPTLDHPFLWESHERRLRQYRLAAATLFHNEGRYLHEWVEYHRLVGVEHFWLHDDASTDGSREVLAPYVDEGTVEIVDWPIPTPANFIGTQVEAQRDALRRATGRAKWLALIDIDEYLLPREDDTVAACLERSFGHACAVYINWRNFGPGGVHLRREGPTLSRLTACAPAVHPDNAIGKSIVRPHEARLDDLWHPHHVPLASGAAYANGDGDLVVSSETEPRLDGHVHDRLLRLNHYSMRDEAFFRSVRLPRARSIGADEWLQWQHHEDFSREEDHEITRFIRERHPRAYGRLWARPEEDWPSLGPYVSAHIMGGLGNNLFQVAAACALAWDNGAQPVFPEFEPGSERYERMFRRCNVGPDRGEWVDWAEPSYAYAPAAFVPDTRLVGYFQSEQHFAHHRGRLCELFAPSPEDRAHLRDAYGELLSEPDTVGVQLRYYRDEFPSGEMYPQYGEAYLRAALEHVPRDALFVVSSNNLEFASASLPPQMQRVVFLEDEPDHVQLLALSACRHQIITNSSFGWWAAWLNPSAQKVVVRPQVWVRGLPDEDVCPADWIGVTAPQA